MEDGDWEQGAGSRLESGWERERTARPDRAMVSGATLLDTGVIGEPQRVEEIAARLRYQLEVMHD